MSMSTRNENGFDDKEQSIRNSEKSNDVAEEKICTPYDNDDDFNDAGGGIPNDEASDQDALDDHDVLGQYEIDTDDHDECETKVFAQEHEKTPEHEDTNTDPSLPLIATVADRIQSANETICTSDAVVEMEKETSPSEAPTSGGVVLDIELVRDELPQLKAPASIQHHSLIADEKMTNSTKFESLVPPRINEKQVISQPGRPNPALEAKETPSKQAAPPIKPSRPTGNKPAPAPSTTSPINQSTLVSRSSRSKQGNSTGSECKEPLNSTAVVCNTSEATECSSRELKAKRAPTKSQEFSKVRQKVSSPRSPSKTHPGAYQHLANEYPPQPRKESVPRQKTSSKSHTSGVAKRKVLQPVRTPANLRFNLPTMDKTKRDWLFVNMFRHRDDLSKYEAFVPPSLLARPPATKDTKKRPLSARQMYSSSHTSRFVYAGRKLVPQPTPEMQDLERKWVVTTPHDSKLPPYDSILDKYCTAVTSPMVQRQIFQTRHRDLSPQLAFVLEKRVEKHCRRGFYDSFGGISSYKTEVVPISPRKGLRSQQTSPTLLSRQV